MPFAAKCELGCAHRGIDSAEVESARGGNPDGAGSQTTVQTRPAPSTIFARQAGSIALHRANTLKLLHRLFEIGTATGSPERILHSEAEDIDEKPGKDEPSLQLLQSDQQVAEPVVPELPAPAKAWTTPTAFLRALSRMAGSFRVRWARRHAFSGRLAFCLASRFCWLSGGDSWPFSECPPSRC